MNIIEVAKKAHVSIATISRAVNPEMRHKVAPETLRKIDVIVKKYGYNPVLAAKNMRSAHFKTIGLLLPHFKRLFDTDYYKQILNGVADALLNSEYRFKLIMLKSDKFHWDENNNLVISKSSQFYWDKYDFRKSEEVDGLLIVHWHLFFSNALAFNKLNLPCSIVNEPAPHVHAYCSAGDNLAGGQLAAKYLYSMGHRKIVVMMGSTASRDSHLRVDGFKKFFKETRHPAQLFYLKGDFHEKVAQIQIETFFKNKNRATAIFCCNDLMAFGVMGKLSELGIRCPKEVSVLGYDNSFRAEISKPSLSSIHVPIYEIAYQGATRLLHYLKDGESDRFFYKKDLFPVRLIERESVLRV